MQIHERNVCLLYILFRAAMNSLLLVIDYLQTNKLITIYFDKKKNKKTLYHF